MPRTSRFMLRAFRTRISPSHALACISATRRARKAARIARNERARRAEYDYIYAVAQLGVYA